MSYDISDEEYFIRAVVCMNHLVIVDRLSELDWLVEVVDEAVKADAKKARNAD